MRMAGFAITVMILLFVTACSLPRIKLFSDEIDPLKEYTLEGSSADKILLIPVEGLISDNPQKSFTRSLPSTVQQVVSQLKKAEKDEHVKALLIKVNSPGGSVTASDILYHEIQSYKVKTGAKIVVSMMDIAVSGAYYLSLPADRIIAHPTTVTGSVGVIFLHTKIRGLMDKIGIAVEIIKSGKNKDMGSLFRESSQEEEIIMQTA